MTAWDKGKWSLLHYRLGNGSKAFGVTLWFNSQRVSIQVDYWIWQTLIMKEF